METPLDRRGFLARASALPLAAASLAVGAGAAAAQQPIRRLGGPKLKTSLNAYSFSAALNDQLKARGPGVSLFDLLDFCAEQDFDALDPTGYFFPGYPEVPKDDYVNRFKRRAFQLGVEISGTGVRNDFATADRARRAADVRHAKEWVEVAARLGAPVLRVFAGPVPAGQAADDVFRWMADALRECAEHGGRFGVLVGVQNHGDMLKTAADVLRLIQLVDSDWFGTIVDTGYFLSPDPYADIARVVPHAVNWQVKEKTDGAAGTAKTDLRRLVRIIREGGYRGYLPIETLSARGAGGAAYDPRARAIDLHAALRAAIREAS